MIYVGAMAEFHAPPIKRYQTSSFFLFLSFYLCDIASIRLMVLLRLNSIRKTNYVSFVCLWRKLPMAMDFSVGAERMANETEKYKIDSSPLSFYFVFALYVGKIKQEIRARR